MSPQEELEELSRAETKSKVAKFLSTEKSIVSKPINPFVGGEPSEGMNVMVPNGNPPPTEE